MPRLTLADVEALEGGDVRVPIIALATFAGLGVAVLVSRMTPLPLADLLFALAVCSFAAFQMIRGEKHRDEHLILPTSTSNSHRDCCSFRDFARRRHELLGLMTQNDTRTRAMALGVGGLVMLLWRLFGSNGHNRTPSITSGRFQVEGWAFTLLASKATKFLTRRVMVTAIWLSHGAARISVKGVVFGFCASVVAMLVLYVDVANWFEVLWRWAAQWIFAITIMDAAWCYIRWSLWHGVISRLYKSGFGPGAASGRNANKRQ